jgi:hypothetical protein
MNKLAPLVIGLLIGFSTNAIAADYEVFGSGSSEVNGYYDEIGTYDSWKDGLGNPMPLYRKLGTDYFMGYRGCATKWIIVEIPNGPEPPTGDSVAGGPGTGHIYGHYTDDPTPPATGWVVKHELTTPSPAPTVNVAAPPTPSTMTWSSEPYEISTSQISMIATTASDPSGPVQYFFDYYSSPTGGAGGNDSTWQTSTSYTDSGLQANHRYGYRVRARDAYNQMNNYSTVSYDYTDIETPSGINFGTLTTTSIQVRSTNTPSGLNRGSSGLILYNVTAGTSSGWQQNNNYWTSGSLAVNTQYGFRARARNGDANTTPYSATYYSYTLANTPGSAAFSNVTETGIRANWTANGNPAGTQYYCENTTAGTNSGWTTSTSWTSSGLSCGTTYSFRVRARNGNEVSTTWTTLGSQATLTCPDITAPTPNPMSWSTEPYETGTTSIAMIATTASDPSGPVEYEFNYTSSPTGGGGGSDSSWQTSTSYTDIGLNPNHQYGYQVRARDAFNNTTGYSTDIETPAGIGFGTITTTSIQMNSTNTPSGLNRDSSGLILYNVTAGTNSGWQQHNNYWTSGSLAVNTQYQFNARARNGDGDQTSISSSGYRYTLANTPGAAAFSDVAETSIRANWTANGNPAGTQYYCENTTNTSWTSSGLTCATTYSFRVQARNGNGVTTDWTTLGSQATADCADTTPPTPDPMTWSTEPYETGTTSIAMIATTASDPSGPVEYEFDYTSSPTGGGGGSDSGWQTSPSYTDNSLSSNHQYGYRVRAKDTADNMTAYSAISYDFTDIEAPSGISFGTITTTSIQVQSSNTPSGLNRGSSGLILYNVTAGTNSGWQQNNNYWTSGSLAVNTQYEFNARARNGDADQTSLSSSGYRYTLANTPGAAAFSDVAETSIRANWTATSNPAGTQYYCENTTAGTNSGWITNTSWTSSGLTCETTYSFKVKARNGDGVETAWVSLGSQATADCANHPPQTPALIWPLDGDSDIPLTPELQADAFDDEDIDDTHAATLWQISTDSNFTSYVLDLMSITQLTSLPIPESVLTAGTDYFWRIRYYDNNNGESEWSLTRKFTTLDPIDTDDPDGDGIPDDQKVTDPTLDLDGDGIPDITQSDIRCVNSVVGNVQIGVSIKNAANVSAIESIRSIDPSTITAPPGAAQNLPYGLLAFKLIVDNLGDPVTVEVFYSNPLPPDVRWLKQDSLHGWQDHTNHVTISADRKSARLNLRDGDIGDCDETENRVIVDPSGPAVFVSPATPPATPPGADSGSDGGGCLIATAAYGSDLDPHVEILRNFRDRFLLNGQLGKRLVYLYYAHSPSVANVISRHNSMRAVVRLLLLPLVGFSWVALKLGLLLTVSILLLICLFGGVFITVFVRKKIRQI